VGIARVHWRSEPRMPSSPGISLRFLQRSIADLSQSDSSARSRLSHLCDTRRTPRDRHHSRRPRDVGIARQATIPSIHAHSGSVIEPRRCPQLIQVGFAGDPAIQQRDEPVRKVLDRYIEPSRRIEHRHRRRRTVWLNMIENDGWIRSNDDRLYRETHDLGSPGNRIGGYSI
jgi:hypothetical protein